MKSLKYLIVPKERLQNLFHEKGWGDGLPMIAPTRDRVEEMLVLQKVLILMKSLRHSRLVMAWRQGESLP